MKCCAIGLIAAGFITAIAGRFATFHDTEMEALVNGWSYWLVGLMLVVVGAVMLKRVGNGES